MAEEPKGWELHRSIEQMREEQNTWFNRLNNRLDKLVTIESFERERQRVDEKFRDYAEDLGTERAQRREGYLELQKMVDRLSSNLKWVAVSIALPIALFLGNLLLPSGGTST